MITKREIRKIVKIIYLEINKNNRTFLLTNY